jgi:hypothetical protein
VRSRNNSDSARSPLPRGDQVKLLEIQSSPRGESSDSISLTKSFIEACKSDNSSIVVDTLNVWHERLPEFDYEAIGAKYKAVKHETMTEAESNVWERIQSLIQRVQNADRIAQKSHARFGHSASRAYGADQRRGRTAVREEGCRHQAKICCPHQAVRYSTYPSRISHWVERHSS